jgi:hypothetical protein
MHTNWKVSQNAKVGSKQLDLIMKTKKHNEKRKNKFTETQNII